jgi:surface antigen
MDTYRVLADGMIKKSVNVDNTAESMLESQHAITKLVNSLTKDDFNGQLPEMMKQKVVGLEEKYDRMHETLTNYAKAIAAAANVYVATDQAIARWADELGVDESAIRGGGTVTPGTGDTANWDSLVGKRIADVENYKWDRYGDNKQYINRGECVWYANYRAQEKGYNLGYLTNANTWWDRAQKDNLSTSSEVRANSIACFGSNSISSVGHVIFVEQVIGDTIYFTEANVEGTISDQQISPNDGVVKKLSKAEFESKYNGALQGYIYL